MSDSSPEFYRFDITDMRIEPLVTAHATWAAKCHDTQVPVWGDLDFLDFESATLPYMALVDIDGEPGYGGYRFWGTEIASANGQTMTNLRIGDLYPARHARYSEAQYRWVVENARPALFVACLFEDGWNQKFEAMLRMPCRSSPDAEIDRVLSIGFYSSAMRSISDYVSAGVDLGDYFGVDI